MRIVILPNVGLNKVESDADYFTYRDFILYATSQYEDMYFYFVLPAKLKTELPELPRTTFVWVEEPVNFVFNEYVASREFLAQFRQAGGHYHSDGMLTSRLVYGMHFKAGVTNTHRRGSYPVVLRETIVKTVWDYKSRWSDTDFMTAAAFTFCPTIFENPRSYAGAVSVVERYMAAAGVERMKKYSYQSSMVVDTDYQDILIKKNKKHERFTLFFGARFNYSKNVALVYQILDKFYASGREIDIIITTPNKQLTLDHLDFTKKYLRGGCIKYLYTDCGRDKYLEEASKCHAFVVDTGITFTIEMLYLGLVGVVPNVDYVDYLLRGDYPYKFDSQEEAYMWLSEIYDDYEKARAAIEPHRQWIAQKYRKQDVFKGEVEFVRGQLQETVENRQPLNFGIPMMREALMEFDKPFRFNTFLAILNKYMINKVEYSDFPMGRMLNPHDVRWTLEKLGYRDTCTESEPIYVKTEDEDPILEGLEDAGDGRDFVGRYVTDEHDGF